ncbi:MAG: choice-of-anchor D domain-containing protein [Cyanobacteria bacterium P01_F01_bin.150]
MTLPTMYANPIYEQSLLEAAQAGKSDAIAHLLQKALPHEGITVTAERHQTQLNIALIREDQGDTDANRQCIKSFIQQSLRQLQPQNIATVQITWSSREPEQTDGQGRRDASFSLLPASQIEALSDDEMQAIAVQLKPPQGPSESSRLEMAVGFHCSQFTENGVLVMPQPQPAESPWQKRRQVDPTYICSPITRLLNRQTELKAGISTLQAGGSISLLGEAGSGKTALLRALCHHPQLLPRFPGGIIYQRAYGRPLEDLIQNVFDALYQHRSSRLSDRQSNQANEQANEQAKGVWDANARKPTAMEQYQHLSQHQLCLVLDDMEPSGELLQELAQWKNLAVLTASDFEINDSASPSSVHPSVKDNLVALNAAKRKTSKHQSVKQWDAGTSNSRHLSMKGLPIKDAVVLFEEGLGRSLQPSEEKDAATLCGQLEGHPRRLIQMAALLRQRQFSLFELVQQLRQNTEPEAIILKAVSGLPESDRRLVAILAAFGGNPVHGKHLPALVDLDNVTVQLFSLVERGLVWTDGTFYRLADNLLAPLNKHWRLAPWLDQSVTYFKSWLEQLNDPGKNGPGNTVSQKGYGHISLTSIKSILENSDILWFLLCHAVDSQRWSDVLDFGRLLEPGLWFGKQWGRWRQALLSQWQAAQSLQDQAAIALILHQLGSRAICLEDGITAHACLAQAFESRMALGDLDGAAISQHNLNVLARSCFALENVVTSQTDHDNRLVPPKLGSEKPKLTGQVNASPAPVLVNQASGQQSFIPSLSLNPSPDLSLNQSQAQSSKLEDTATATGKTSASSPGTSDSTTAKASSDSSNPPEEVILLSSPSRFSWLWLLVGGGSLAIISLIAFLLGQKPQTDISRLRPKHTFPPQRIGVISEPHKFIITNTTPAPIAIDVDFETGDRQDFTINSNDCVSQSLEPDEVCTISATFEPQENGPRSASFMVQVGKNTDPKRLILQGVGANVKADVQPLDITFKPQRLTERSTPQTITLNNNGTVAFMVQKSNFVNNEDNAFFIEKDTCVGQILQPRDDCNLTVSFLPTNEANYQTNLAIIDDIGQEIGRVLLVGEGTLPISPGPRSSSDRSNQRPTQRADSDNRSSPSVGNETTIPESPTNSSSQASQFTVSPAAIAFEQQEINNVDRSTLRIQNTGASPLSFNDITLGGEPFTLTQESCLDRPIEPGNECVVEIAFAPTIAQTYASNLVIVSPTETKTIAINGTGISPSEPLPPDDSNLNLPSPAITNFSVSPNTTINPNDIVELCYDLENVEAAYILNRTTKEQITVSPDSPGCLPQTVTDTTAYTLVGFQESYDPVEQSLTVVVAEVDSEPPPTPEAIAPTGSSPTYCNSSVVLKWQSVTDNGGPVSYEVNLQRQDIASSDTGAIKPSSTWTAISSERVSQTSLNISSAAQSPHLYRWRVQAIDAAGNTSTPTGWNEFLCINP